MQRLTWVIIYDSWDEDAIFGTEETCAGSESVCVGGWGTWWEALGTSRRPGCNTSITEGRRRSFRSHQGRARSWVAMGPVSLCQFSASSEGTTQHSPGGWGKAYLGWWVCQTPTPPHHHCWGSLAWLSLGSEKLTLAGTAVILETAQIGLGVRPGP